MDLERRFSLFRAYIRAQLQQLLEMLLKNSILGTHLGRSLAHQSEAKGIAMHQRDNVFCITI